MSSYNEQRFRRTWFPDEQVAPGLVLDALVSRRKLAVTDPAAYPWMSSADIGLALGLVKDSRWTPTDRPLEDLLTPDPRTCHRKLPWGLRWRHPVAQRDVRAALNHYEAEGQVVRLPHPLATWPVHVAPLDDADRAAMVAAWSGMDEDRETARHKQRLHRLAAGRRAAGG